MPLIKLNQFQYETEGWRRILDFMMDENIHLKNRLSAILNNKFDKNLLEEVEQFHSSFVREDQLIGLLRNNLAELDRLLILSNMNDDKVIGEIELKFTSLRNNITTAEKQFGKLKFEFNSYLSENIE